MAMRHSETTHRQRRPSSMLGQLPVVNPVKGVLLFFLFGPSALCDSISKDFTIDLSI